jgi:hypothetical protein
MDLEDLLDQSPSELDRIFSRAEAGPIPQGDAEGEAILCSGSLWARVVARFVHELAWKGKIFRQHEPGDATTLENKIGPDGVPAILARVYFASSWYDQKKCIVLDYSKTSFLARKIRDEMRLVDGSSQTYLGKVWWGRMHLCEFALRFRARP